MMRVPTLLLALLLLLAAVGCTATEDTNDAPTPSGNDGEPLSPVGSDDDEPTPADSGNDEPTPADAGDDAAQIYAAAIRQIYHVDHSFGEPPGWPLVYVVSVTDDSAMVDAPTAPSQTLSPGLQEAITAELSDQPFELIWIDSPDEAPIDPTNGQIAEGDGIIITLGNIHPKDDGSVQLPFFMTCGGLCGIGKTYVLGQAGDAWAVTGSVGPEIMS